MATIADIAPTLAGHRDTGGSRSALGRAAGMARAAWKGAVTGPLHRVLDRHARGAGLHALNAATLRDLGLR